MITATGLELRAGARLLLGEATFRIAPGDRVGLVGRNGAGKTTLTRVLSGETQPAAGTVTRSGQVGYLPQDPRTGDLRRAGPRPHPVGPRARRGGPPDAQHRGRDGQRRPRHPRAGDAPLRPAGGGVPGRRGVRRRERGRRDLVQPRAAGAGARPAAAHAVRRAAAARRAVPDPVLLDRLRRDAAARRAHQPPRRRLDHLAAGLPQDLPGRPGGHQPRRRPARAHASTGSSTSTPTGPRSTSTTSAGRPTCSSARPTSGAASGSGPTSRSRRRCSRRRPTGCATRPPRPGRRRAWTSGPTKLLSGLDEVAPARQGRQAALPGPGAVRQDAADGRGAVEVLRLAGDLHRRRPGHRPRQPGGHPRPQRRGQDDAAAAAGRRRGARHRRGRARPRAASSATTRRSTRRSTATAPCSRTCAAPRRTCADAEVRRVLGSFLFSGDDVDKPAGVLSGGEKTRLALATLVVSSANVLLLDEPTNNLDPASREEILGALRTFTGRGGPGDPRRGRGRRPAARAADPAPRRRRGPLERGLRRPRRARLTALPTRKSTTFGSRVGALPGVDASQPADPPGNTWSNQDSAAVKR